jgi:REP element-mobilizing transposase RayT
MNRGNYREHIFSVSDAGEIFEETLFDACSRYGWLLHAYVCLSNHFHLAVETPEANLVRGMQWLSSTFGNRFNRLVRQCGHIFQGRYKSLLIEDGGYLLQVVNYIHLNPVRAHMVEPKNLRTYSLSSFPKFFRKKRPPCLTNESWLHLAGNLRSTAAGMRCYHQYLELCNEQNPAKQKEMHRRLCRGWHIGTRQGKQAVLQDIAAGMIGADLQEAVCCFGNDGGHVLLQRGLSCLKKDEKDLLSDRKGALWKIVLASWIKVQCGVSNAWLSEHLHMGHPSNVSRMISIETKAGQAHRKLWRKLKSAK